MKKTVIIISVLLLPAIAFAAITGTGTGLTEAEAYSDALLALSKQVSVSFTGIDYDTTSVSNNELTNSEYTTRNLSATSVDYFGLEVLTKETETGYEVTLTIPDSAASLYKTRLEELQIDINSLKKVIDAGNDELKLSNLPSLYKLVKDYEANRSILTRLDSNYSPKALSVGSASGIKAQYDALYSAQSQKDNLKLQEYDHKVALGILSSESEKLYQEKLKEIEQRQAEYSEMKKIAEDNYVQKAAELELQVSAWKESLQATVVTPKETSEIFTISSAINSIEAYKILFSDYKKELNSKLGVFQRQYKTERNNLVRKALTQAVTDSDWENGKLKTGSKTQIQNAVRKEVSTMLGAYQQDAISVYSVGFKLLKQIVQNANEAIKEVCEKTITISSTNDPSLRVSVDTKSFTNNSWEAMATLDVYGYTFEIPFTIGYQAWTGESAAIDSIDARIKFNKMKAAWESVLAEYANEAMEVVLTLKIQTAIDSDGYKVTITSYKVINKNNGKIVNSRSGCNISKTIMLDSSCNLMDFSLDNDLLLVTAPEVKEGEDYARYYRILTDQEESKLGNQISLYYLGLNGTKEKKTLNLYRRNSFNLQLTSGRNSNDYFSAWNHYDDVLLTFDTTQIEYTGSIKWTLEKTVSTTRIGNLYYYFDEDEVFNLFDCAHVWKTIRLEHYNYYDFKVKDNAEFGNTEIKAVLLKNSEKVYEGSYKINVRKPLLDASYTYVGASYKENNRSGSSGVSSISYRISPSQPVYFSYKITNSGLDSYGGEAIDGLTIVYDESKYSVKVTQEKKNIYPLSTSRDGNIVTAKYSVLSTSFLDIKTTMKRGTPAGRDTMEFWYTLDGERASAKITATLEASTTAWN